MILPLRYEYYPRNAGRQLCDAPLCDANAQALALMPGPKQEVVVVEISQVDFDHEREVAYRRGYVRGVSVAISGIAHKLTVEEREALDRWFDDELTKWTKSSAPSCLSIAPEFPKAN